MISMRSRSGGGIGSSWLAVVMNITLREVERQVEVVVAEGEVLLGVEHLEQGAGRVAAPVGAHLVDLVDHEQRVVGAGVAHGAHDDAGHRAHVRAAMPADLGLVAHAAHADALELAAHRLGDGRPRLVLPTPGGPTKQRIGPCRSAFSLRTARYSRMRSLTLSRS